MEIFSAGAGAHEQAIRVSTRGIAAMRLAVLC